MTSRPRVPASVLTIVLAAISAAACPGCASSHPPDTLDELMPALPPPATPAPGPEVTQGAIPPASACPVEPDDPAVPTVLTRDVARAVIDRGFGRFLARLDVSPVLSHGRFVGFRLECATDLSRWHAAGADIRVGDVITRVNGRSIELPDTALAVFEGLRTAPELTVELLRDGVPVTVRHPITTAR